MLWDVSNRTGDLVPLFNGVLHRTTIGRENADFKDSAIGFTVGCFKALGACQIMMKIHHLW